ncbi:MAG: hypothetical protein ACPG06_10295 [Alphaproteobacteria bacterium]
MARRAFGFIVSVLVTAILATALSAQMVISGLVRAGAEIDFGTSLTFTAEDVVSMGPVYAILIAIGLLIAFSVSALTLRLIPAPRAGVYIAAGAAALLAILLGAEQAFFGNQIISGARDTTGIAAQAIAGGMGGWLFARLTAKAG